MKFKAPQGVSGISHRGMAFYVVDGVVEVDNTQLGDDAILSQAFGLTLIVPTEDSEAAAKDEKAEIMAKLSALGIKPDARRSVASLRDQLAEASKGASD